MYKIIELNFCPRCGSPTKKYLDTNDMKCNKCGTIYKNIISNIDNKITIASKGEIVDGKL